MTVKDYLNKVAAKQAKKWEVVQDMEHFDTLPPNAEFRVKMVGDNVVVQYHIPESEVVPATKKSL